jgi:hypothetical protein
MPTFKWIEWNLQKINAHALSADDVEAAFRRTESIDPQSDGSFEMLARTPSGRRILVVWRYDTQDSDIPDIMGDLPDPAIFVITAY